MCVCHAAVRGEPGGRPVHSREIIVALQRAGWRLVRVKGSHHVFRHPAHPFPVVVPHPRRDLPTGLVRALERQTGLRLR